MSENDPKYSHFAESVTRGRNIPEKNTNHGEASRGTQMDFFTNAEERYCDESAYEAMSEPEIEQVAEYSRDREARSLARHHRSEGERDYGKRTPTREDRSEEGEETNE